MRSINSGVSAAQGDNFLLLSRYSGMPTFSTHVFEIWTGSKFKILSQLVCAKFPSINIPSNFYFKCDCSLCLVRYCNIKVNIYTTSKFSWSSGKAYYRYGGRFTITFLTSRRFWLKELRQNASWIICSGISSRFRGLSSPAEIFSSLRTGEVEPD